MTQVDNEDTNLDEVVAEAAYEDTHEDINSTDPGMHTENVKKQIVENTQTPENHLLIHSNDLHGQSVLDATRGSTNTTVTIQLD